MNILPLRKIIILCLIAALFAVSVFPLLGPVSDPDFFWHLKSGQWIWQHTSLPSEDPFSYTAQGLQSSRAHSVLTSSFLSQVTYFLFYLAGGMTGIVAFRFIMLGLLLFIMFRRKEGDLILYMGLLLIFSTLFLRLYALERPQIFSFFFFGVLLFWLKKLRSGPPASVKMLYVFIPLLMLLWANTHQGYVLGQLTLLLFIVMEGIKFLRPSFRPMEKGIYRNAAYAGAVGILLSFANPNTWHTWADMVFQPAVTIVDNIEYQSTLDAFFLYHSQVIGLYWFVLLLVIAGVLLSRKHTDLTELALLAGAGYVSFTSQRYIAIFLIVALPFAGRIFSEGKRLRYAIPVILAVALAGGLFFTWNDRSNLRDLGSGSWINSAYPAGAADFVLAHDLRGNMFNEYNWGAYLIWRLAPEKKVFIDGRCLDPVVVKKSILVETASRKKISGTPAWKSILESYGVEYIIIPFSQPDGTLLPLVPALLREKDWTPVFLHLNSVVFVKDSPANSEVMGEYSIPKDYFFAGMLKVCDSFIQAYPLDIFPYITKGDLYLVAFRLEEARQTYEKVLSIAPLNTTAKERLQLLLKLRQQAG